MSIRLSKLLSQKGLCSRREADRYIEKGLVAVNGTPVSTLGIKVEPSDKVELLRPKKQTTILLYKPLGYVSCLPEGKQKSAYSLLEDLPWRKREKLGVCGRLDINSSGLLLFTQDGALAKTIIGENSRMEKEYLVRLDQNPTKEQLEMLRIGLELDGRPLRRAKVDVMGENFIKMVLCEGRYRQIRRMCDLLGLGVRAIKRVRIGPYRLGRLEIGKWKEI